MRDIIETIVIYLLYMLAAVAVVFMCVSLFTACTFNFSMVHTEGLATDVVDDITETKADSNLDIPLIGAP